MLKKFKNGNITVKLDKGQTIDELYNQDFFWNDMYLNQINGYPYIIDYNTRIVYDLSFYWTGGNILKDIEFEIKKNGKIKMYPLSKKESNSLIQNCENGY